MRLFYLGIALILLCFCFTASAQTRATAQTMKLDASSVATAEVKRLCPSGKAKAKKKGKKTVYYCESTPSSAQRVSSKPKEQRSEINCDYKESGGVTTWLGCTCKADEDGNCNQFISNCVEGGDNVGGNSNGASCSPPP